MEFYYNVEAVDGQPAVAISKEGVVNIVGESRPEDGRFFYEKVFKEIHNCNFKELRIVFYLDYVSSSSTLSIIKFLKDVTRLNLLNLELIWEYDEEDDDLKELGELFVIEKQIPISLKAR